MIHTGTLFRIAGLRRFQIAVVAQRGKIEGREKKVLEHNITTEGGTYSGRLSGSVRYFFGCFTKGSL